MLIPGFRKELERCVDCWKKNKVKKPNVVAVVNVKPMSELKHNKQITPSSTNLSSDINPQAFNSDIVNTSGKEK